MKWPISSHNNQAEHHAPCHHAVCQHKSVEPCSDLLVVAAVSVVVLVGVAPSFAAAEQERCIVVAAVGEHTAAVADSQHYTAAAAVVVLDRILLERTCWYGFNANRLLSTLLGVTFCHGRFFRRIFRPSFVILR